MLSEKSPFYRNPALWLVVLVPSVTVVMGLVFLVFSIIYQDDLVVDDYYKVGKQINRVLERDAYASEQGIYATISLDRERRLVFARLESDNGSVVSWPEQLTLKFIHRTIAENDKVFLMQQNAHSGYYAVLEDMPAGRWLVELGTPQWRLKDRLELAGQAEFSLTAGERNE